MLKKLRKEKIIGYIFGAIILILIAIFCANYFLGKKIKPKVLTLNTKIQAKVLSIGQDNDALSIEIMTCSYAKQPDNRDLCVQYQPPGGAFFNIHDVSLNQESAPIKVGDTIEGYIYTKSFPNQKIKEHNMRHVMVVN